MADRGHKTAALSLAVAEADLERVAGEVALVGARHQLRPRQRSLIGIRAGAFCNVMAISWGPFLVYT